MNREAAASDADLVARARWGDAAAFETLVRRHYRAAYAVALAILARPADAEDACQDAWVRALEKLDTCRQPERFIFWLLQIARNRARNLLEARRLRAAEPLDTGGHGAGDNDDPPAVSAAAPDDPRRDYERERLRERLLAGLAEISEVQREIVLLHEMEGWPHREIAEHLGISEVNCRQHLLQARRRLRAILGDAFLGELNGDG
jgi:RNA polymerase sigma-70 factor (ECF subfamily)